jgi:nitrous oxidase accessory protein
MMMGWGLVAMMAVVGAVPTPEAEAERGAGPFPAQASQGKATRVAPGLNLQEQLDLAETGSVIQLAPGKHRGPIVIKKSLTLRGDGATIDGGGQGTVVRVDAPGVSLQGLKVIRSGSSLMDTDTCVYLTPKARYAEIKDNHLEDCAFGIWVHTPLHVRIENNQVFGQKDAHPSDKGNGIHLFDAGRVSVVGNTVRDARDGIYISATEDSYIAKNTVSNMRYGVHYMYSYRNTLENNRSTKNTGGYALMESEDLVIRGNVAEDNAEHGIMFRSAERCLIEKNVSRRNGNGLFFYSSAYNVIRDNVLEGNQVGMKIWAGTVDNTIAGNVLRSNAQQVFYVAASDLHLGRAGRGNYWSDYLGWDQDADGIGDRPYRVDGFISTLLYKHPSVLFLLRSPALELLNHLENRLPILRTPTVIDDAPLVDTRESP